MFACDLYTIPGDTVRHSVQLKFLCLLICRCPIYHVRKYLNTWAHGYMTTAVRASKTSLQTSGPTQFCRCTVSPVIVELRTSSTSSALNADRPFSPQQYVIVPLFSDVPNGARYDIHLSLCHCLLASDTCGLPIGAILIFGPHAIDDISMRSARDSWSGKVFLCQRVYRSDP